MSLTQPPISVDTKRSVPPRVRKRVRKQEDSDNENEEGEENRVKKLRISPVAVSIFNRPTPASPPSLLQPTQDGEWCIVKDVRRGVVEWMFGLRKKFIHRSAIYRAVQLYDECMEKITETYLWKSTILYIASACVLIAEKRDSDWPANELLLYLAISIDKKARSSTRQLKLVKKEIIKMEADVVKFKNWTLSPPIYDEICVWFENVALPLFQKLHLIPRLFLFMDQIILDHTIYRQYPMSTWIQLMIQVIWPGFEKSHNLPAIHPTWVAALTPLYKQSLVYLNDEQQLHIFRATWLQPSMLSLKYDNVEYY